MKDLLTTTMKKNSSEGGKTMDTKTNSYSLPTLEELLSLMEDEDLSLKKTETTTNAYSVYSVYDSGPCIDNKE